MAAAPVRHPLGPIYMDRKYYHILLFLFSINCFFGQTLSCLIRTDKEIYQTKDIIAHKYPIITIAIKNNTDSTINIVTGLDGSSSRQRFPYAFFNIQLLGDTAQQDRKGYCGNYDGIHTDAFIKIDAQQTLVSDTKENILFYDHFLYDKNTFQRKGKYKISFYYSTNETNFKKWMGDKYIGQQYKWFDSQTGNVLPEYKDEYNELVVLFSKVPKTELTSNEITIEVK